MLPGITSPQAYAQHLHDRTSCACGHTGGTHGHLTTRTGQTLIGRGECYTCRCPRFAVADPFDPITRYPAR